MGDLRMNLSINPEFKNLIPALDKNEYDQLNDTWGLLVPILRLTHVGIAKHISLYPENMALA